MSAERRAESMPGVVQALSELKHAIQTEYPDATFAVAPAQDDDKAIDLVATVDIPDPDEVMDLVIDRVLAIQLERGLPIHVVPVRPADRAIAEMAASNQATSQSSQHPLL
jgi:hypothetical protein